MDSLNVVSYDEEIYNKYKEVTLSKSGKRVELNFMTPRMLDQIEVKKRDDKKRQAKSTGTKIDGSLLYTLSAIIKSIDGRVYDPIKKEAFLRSLPLADTNLILKYGEKLNTCMGLEAILDNICSNCGGSYKVPFRLTSEFFGPSIE